MNVFNFIFKLEFFYQQETVFRKRLVGGALRGTTARLQSHRK